MCSAFQGGGVLSVNNSILTRIVSRIIILPNMDVIKEEIRPQNSYYC